MSSPIVALNRMKSKYKKSSILDINNSLMIVSPLASLSSIAFPAKDYPDRDDKEQKLLEIEEYD